jgi:hypothetical protein
MLGGDGILVVLDCLTAEDRLVAVGVDQCSLMWKTCLPITCGGCGPGGMEDNRRSCAKA